MRPLSYAPVLGNVKYAVLEIKQLNEFKTLFRVILIMYEALFFLIPYSANLSKIHLKSSSSVC